MKTVAYILLALGSIVGALSLLVLAVTFYPLILLLLGIEHPPDPLNIGWAGLGGGGSAG